ncbi:hypothetical protein JYT51_01865 [Candidatus Amoebophilus asiaticus]|nr:hypothetical protein [Candidatus Amoebophilus asiaticus]
MDLTENSAATWSILKKIIFRFICVYFLIYVVELPLQLIPFGEFLSAYYYGFWDSLILFTGEKILNVGYEIDVEMNGSGDTTYYYIQALIILTLSVMTCLIWTLADNKPKDYNKLLYWFTVIIRYYLIITLMSYGFAKIFKTQFPAPSLYRLLEPYGESMGLAWTFMGYSSLYNIFTGSAEVLGGVLLLYRRTTTLASLILIAVMSNVLAMNLAYDIPVKLFSFHLLLMGIFLLSIDIKRVLNFFILNKSTSLSNFTTPYSGRAMGISRIVLKVLFIGFFSFTMISEEIEAGEKWGDNRPKPPLYGMYEVETFIYDGDTLPPLLTDNTRWKKMTIEWEEHVVIYLMNDSTKGYAFKPDTVEKTITMYSYADTTSKYLFKYLQPTNDHLTFSGVLKEDSLTIHMKKIDINKFLLVNRGFHWINESPYNR